MREQLVLASRAQGERERYVAVFEKPQQIRVDHVPTVGRFNLPRIGLPGATVVGHKIPDQHWGTRGGILDVAFAVGAVAVALALPAVAARLGVRRLGRIGTRTAQVGHVAIAVECVASTIHGGNTLEPVFTLGLLASLVGLVLLGIDALRAGVARALALLPFLALLVGIAGGNQGGAIVIGIVWGFFAATLTRNAEPAAVAARTA